MLRDRATRDGGTQCNGWTFIFYFGGVEMKNNEITSRNQWPVKRGRTDGLSARRRRTAVTTGAGGGRLA